MKYSTCVSIADKSPRIMLERLSEALKHSQYAELRLDYIGISQIEPLLEAASEHLDRTVCTLRPAGEGGMYEGGEGDRVRMLETISEYGPFLLDVEYSVASTKNVTGQMGCDIMVSWHDFGGTPNPDALAQQMERMAAHSDMVKIATMAKSPADAASVMALYARAPCTLVAFAMGDVGRFTRLCALRMGSPFMYAHMGRAVAPGQYSVFEVRQIEEEGII